MNWGPSHPSWPHRPTVWDREAIETTRMINESSHTIETGLQVLSDALREQNTRINDDIVLLLRAGIGFDRMTLATSASESKRTLMVDGNPVQHYTIRYVVDGESLPK
jgi:hypothetical protein